VVADGVNHRYAGVEAGDVGVMAVLLSRLIESATSTITTATVTRIAGSARRGRAGVWSVGGGVGASTSEAQLADYGLAMVEEIATLERVDGAALAAFLTEGDTRLDAEQLLQTFTAWTTDVAATCSPRPRHCRPRPGRPVWPPPRSLPPSKRLAPTSLRTSLPPTGWPLGDGHGTTKAWAP
jgi:hypothetical protein